MNRQIQEAVEKLSGKQLSDEVYYTACSVVSVDMPTLTCYCTPIGGTGGTDIPNVMLMAETDDGFLLIPAIGSTVIVVHSEHSDPYVSLFSNVETWNLSSDSGGQFNDGSFGGLTKTLELQEQLNKTTALLQAVLNIINGAPIDEPGNGSPSALQVALRTAVAEQELGDFSEIENTLITHGV